MDVGKMTKRIMLQKRSLTEDEGGGRVVAWVDVIAIWAAVTPKSANPILLAAMPQQQRTHEVIVRYRPEITKKDRFLFKGRVFTIDNIINVDEANEFLQISCIENGV